MNPADVATFRNWLQRAKRVAVLTGAGISAESGVPTFRGQTAGGTWRGYEAPEVASPRTWKRNPGLVWEFYGYRRRIMGDKRPNRGHLALADLERRLVAAGRQFDLITQNIDDLHLDAGSARVIRLHGSIWKVRCVACEEIDDNRDVPIAPAFAGRDDSSEEMDEREYEKSELPTCRHCGEVVRPHIVWFGESLDPMDLLAAGEAAADCDLFLIVGTSAVVYPAAQLAPLAKQHGANVVEINLEKTPMTSVCDLSFHGKAGEILPELFATDLGELG